MIDKKHHEIDPQMSFAQAEKEIDGICMTMREARNQPLLIMYYPDEGHGIVDSDVEALYEEFRRLGYNNSTNRIKALDVLIHISGGRPQPSYMASQVLRRLAPSVNFLVPYRATGAGALVCLCADIIYFGAYAHVSPTNSARDSTLDPIDFMVDFAVRRRLKADAAFKHDAKPMSGIQSELLRESLRKVDPARVAELYRQRAIMSTYVCRLLADYMFASDPRREETAAHISQVLSGYPEGDFYMDYCICKLLGLKVAEMSDDHSDMTKRIVRTLDRYAISGIICETTKDRKMPFIALY